MYITLFDSFLEDSADKLCTLIYQIKMYNDCVPKKTLIPNICSYVNHHDHHCYNRLFI